MENEVTREISSITDRPLKTKRGDCRNIREGEGTYYVVKGGKVIRTILRGITACETLETLSPPPSPRHDVSLH